MSDQVEKGVWNAIYFRFSIGRFSQRGSIHLSAQNERAMHPRIAAAIEALKEAHAYMAAAPHDFGGHKADAMRASETAIRELNQALRYRAVQDRRK